MAKITINQAALQNRFQQALRNKSEPFRRSLEANLKELAPKDTNALRDSIVVEIAPRSSFLGGVHFDIKIQVEYASFVVQGTRAHVISGNPYLAFNWKARGGIRVITTHVNHPGNDPNEKWIEDAVRKAARENGLRF